MLWLIASALAGTATLIGKFAYDRYAENQTNAVVQTSTVADDDLSDDETGSESLAGDSARSGDEDVTEVDFLLPIPNPQDEPSDGTEPVDPVDPILLPYDDTHDDYNEGVETVDTIDPILLPGDEFIDGTETVSIAPVNIDDWI